MKRLFAAIKTDPGEDFLKSYRGLRKMLAGESVKWVEEHNLHITLKFFGETDERLIPGISASLAGISAAMPGPCFQLSGLGIFGSRYNPRVVWSGIQPYEPLVVMMKKFQEEMVRHGFEADRQNSVPHLTLGRIKFLNDKERFARALDFFRNIGSESRNIPECILYESILRKEGPEYRVLQKFPFAK